MELLERTFVIAILLIVIFVAAYYLIKHVFASSITEAQAVTLVKQDLLNSNPGAIINVTNVTNSTYQGSWHIVLSVIFNSTSPCPSYYIYSFDYPQYGFVPRTQNIYTNNCTIYGLTQGAQFTISSFPVAIVRAYTLGIGNVTRFVNKFGYKNIHVTASFFSNETIMNKTYANIWLVNFASNVANYSTKVVIAQYDGSELLSYNSS